MSRPRVGLERLRMFAVIAAHEHVSRAADELGMSQPALSAQLRALERELGVALVMPSGRGVRLTEAGRLVQGYARRVGAAVDALQEDVAALRGLARGHLRLGASQTIGTYSLPGWLAALHRASPGITLTVRVANTDALVGALRGEEIDVGVDAAATAAPDLDAVTVGEDRLVLVAPPGDAPVDLAQSTLIVREPGSATRRLVEQALSGAGVRPAATIELGSPEGIVRAVAAGLGVAFTSAHATRHGGVRIVDTPGIDLRRPVRLVTRRGHVLSPAEHALLDAIRYSR